MHDNVFKTIFNCGIVPVIKLEDSADAVPLCKALLDGGINVAEITFRTDAAEESIKKAASELPDVLVGAGTVLSVAQAEKAINAGAKFIVSPGFNEKVVEYCISKDIPILPGTSCPSDIEKALSLGLEAVKFFPAEANGGVQTLKALSAAYTTVKFMPTGGVSPANINDYLKLDCIFACGGSWMVKDDLVKAKNFDEITKLTKEAVKALHNFRFDHMAVNEDSMEASFETAEAFNAIFATGARKTSKGAFAGDFIEVIGCKSMTRGTKGHIGFKTNNVARAIAYFEKIGAALNYDTLLGTPEKPEFIYLENEIGGFAVHIMKG